MDIQLLGTHNIESRNTKCMSLLIDDILAIDAGGLTSSLPFSAQLKLKAILLTHPHYDHIRDIPALAMNLALQRATIDVYSISAVYEALTAYLLNGTLYPNFFQRPEPNPTLRFTAIEPLQTRQIENYSVIAVSLKHSVPAVGFQITSRDGKILFYTGDTGPGLSGCWQHVSPQLLIVETTMPNRFEKFAKDSEHLTPNLLKGELISFRELKGYLPQVVLVHMNPYIEKEIKQEAETLAKALDNSITLGYEGMRIHL